MKKSKIVQNIVFVTVALSLLVVMLSVSVSATSQSNIVFSCTEFDSVRGETFTTTIYAQEGSNVTGLNLTLKYNSEYVTLVSYDVLRASEVNVNGNTIEISYADADNVTTELKLVELTFSVDDNLSEGLYHDWLVWSNNSEDDAFTTTGFNNGTPQYEDLTIETAFPALFIRQQGDAYNNNYDGKVNARDASYILQHAAHMFTMPAVDQRYANVYTNDNLSDGTAKISARDASLILQYAAHMDVALSDRINVTFYALDESGNYIVQVVKSVKKGSDLTKLPSVLSKGEGKEGSWSASAEGFIAPDFTNITESLNIYAHYEDAVFSITYDYDTQKGAYADGVSNFMSYTEKDSFTLNSLVANEGYVFDGWYNNYGDKVTEIKTGTTGDITLTARWSLVEYKITYDLGNATNSPNNVDNGKTDKTYTIESKTFTLASPTLAGYHFVGWLDENGHLIKQITEGTTGNIHLTPKWSGVTASIVPYTQINSPIYNQVDKIDQADGKILYIYYLGYIANVPTGTADELNIVDYNGTGEFTLSITESNSTTTSTTTYGKVVNSKTTNWENGLAEKVEIKAESEAFGGIVKGSVSGSVEAHQSWGQNITGTHESGQDVVKGEVSETVKSQTYTLSPDKNPVGYYWYSIKTSVDVFALVEYDPVTQTITYDTARVWRDLYTAGWTYAATIDEIKTADVSGDYEDFCFEVPDAFFDDIAKLAGGSTGLIAQENGTNCSIVGYTGTDTDVQIPTYLNGKKVTSIDANLFAGNTSVTSVSFGKGITSVPDSAFVGCTSLNSVVFEGELTKIGANAFKGCSLLEFEIPDTVTSIGDAAFDGCVAMDNVLITNTVAELGTSVFNNCGELSLIINHNRLELIQNAISSGATDIDVIWSDESGIDANATLTVPTIQKFTFNGNKQTFNNLCIVSDAIDTTLEYTTIKNTTGETALVFSSTNVNMRDVEVESNKTALALSADCVNLSIGATVELKAKNGHDGLTANDLIVSSAVNEAATFKITGGAGNPGGCGMEIANTVTFRGYLTVNVIGGSGNAGANGSTSGKCERGASGGSGSNGGIAISAVSIVVNDNVIMEITGGEGGKGGNGGNGWSALSVGDSQGGHAGSGGNGGDAISADSITISELGSVTAIGGAGGAGGTGGKGEQYGSDDANGGDGGDGGDGGCSYNSSCVIVDEVGKSIFNPGAAGAAGSGGAGDGSDGHYGSNGSAGTAGER